MTNPRHTAINILCKRSETRLPVDQLMDAELGKTQLEPRDTHLVTALVYGVLRNQRYLDYIISRFSRHPLSKMKPLTRQALRVGIFQICFLDRIPASAAVNETIKALQKAKQPKWLTGFVNGLLRSIVRKRDTEASSFPDAASLPPNIRFSHPDWLFERWLERYGQQETERICSVNTVQTPLTLRLRKAADDRSAYLSCLHDMGIKAQAGITGESVILQDYRGNVQLLPGFAEGRFLVQDEGAQLISLMLCPLGQGRHLDSCAGLGGKTIHIADMLPEESSVIAIEPNQMRFALLQDNISRTNTRDKITCHGTTLADFAAQENSVFQSVLVDAPCSGTGVIRNHPDIRWNRQPHDLERYQKLQHELLEKAAHLVAPGGVLVYATCSTEPEENEMVIHEFLEKHGEFAVNPPPCLPDKARKFINTEGFLQMTPAENHGGFFACRLRKK